MRRSICRDSFGLRGLTLLEVLAVVVIASTASAVLLTSLANADRNAAMLETVSRWQDMDQRGRLFAQIEGAAMFLNIDRDNHAIGLDTASSSGDATSLSQFELPRGLSPSFVSCSEGRSFPEIEIDRLGRSVDYTAIFATDWGMARREVCGLTGWIIEQDEPP